MGCIDMQAALYEVSCKWLCREGEAADNLYVIQSGVFEAFKTSKDGERVLFKYEGAGAFGELALMYNCPRAATVRVTHKKPCSTEQSQTILP